MFWQLAASSESPHQEGDLVSRRGYDSDWSAPQVWKSVGKYRKATSRKVDAYKNNRVEHLYWGDVCAGPTMGSRIGGTPLSSEDCNKQLATQIREAKQVIQVFSGSSCLVHAHWVCVFSVQGIEGMSPNAGPMLQITSTSGMIQPDKIVGMTPAPKWMAESLSHYRYGFQDRNVATFTVLARKVS